MYILIRTVAYFIGINNAWNTGTIASGIKEYSNINTFYMASFITIKPHINE